MYILSKSNFTVNVRYLKQDQMDKYAKVMTDKKKSILPS